MLLYREAVEFLRGRELPVEPPLHELYHRNPFSVPHRAQRGAEGRGRFALSIAGVELNRAPFSTVHTDLSFEANGTLPARGGATS